MDRVFCLKFRGSENPILGWVSQITICALPNIGIWTLLLIYMAVERWNDSLDREPRNGSTVTQINDLSVCEIEERSRQAYHEVLPCILSRRIQAFVKHLFCALHISAVNLEALRIVQH